MATLQSNFRRFHQAIKLDRFDEEATLREKRDRVLDRIRAGGLRFEWFNQGSYEMGTGVVPVNGDYDIDVGLILPGSTSQDPVAVKQSVYDAVKAHTTRVEFRRPCITVYYQRAGEAIYHVDLPVYVRDAYGRLHLATGKQNSGADQRRWIHSEPVQLCKAVWERWSGEDGAQFRRVIQYLKRWRDERFPTEGNAAPVGVGLTLAAYHWFQPGKTWTGWSADYDDLGATRTVVSALLGAFQQTWGGSGFVRRANLRLPVQPGNDVFERMTDQQMVEFEQRLAALRDALDAAARSGDGTGLRRVFGSAFPA